LGEGRTVAVGFLFLRKKHRHPVCTLRENKPCNWDRIVQEDAMPVSYRIDAEAEIVFSEGSGCVTDAEALDHQDRLRADPNFRPHFRQLIDLRDMTKVEVSADTVLQLGERNPFGQGARRAAVVTDRFAYALLRMFQIFTQRSLDQFHIFDHIDAAREWLGLDLVGEKDTPPAPAA
jgi:hypothetical protein